MQIIEGKVSENDATTFIREKLSFMEADMTPRELTLVSSRLCDCGALLGDKNRLVGKAECCGVFTCEMCRIQCMHCGKIICRRHGITYSDGEVYCWRCKPIKWGKILLDIGKRIVK